MIHYTLRCKKDHAFEGWFRDSASFEAEVAAKRLSCPTCNSKIIERAPMAPAVARSGEKREAAKDPKAMRKMLLAMRKQIEATHDYVGPAFAEEARKIHYGETEERGIYGETSAEEAAALADEGVPVASVPWIERGDA